MTHPIIIAAFGTTSRSRLVYEEVDRHLKSRFPGHEIHWAFTSRIVRHQLKQRRVQTLDPAAAVARLAGQGHAWAVVQSFNIICGHEFHRLVSDVQHPVCRVSVGHSLLCSQQDHQAAAEALAPVFERDENEAVVMVGHGTDHCAWTVYPAFYHRLAEMYGNRAFGGMIEEGWPSRESVVRRIIDAGFRRVRLMPFMLVAGVHFEEDLAGPEDSWKAALETQGLEVVLERDALGRRSAIIDILAGHVCDALAVIPSNGAGRPPCRPGKNAMR
ncbi:MAG: cobalt chelatase [Desulfatitalea sp.]|nr:sirohydrochlorin cobaltochelatase [Desulfatitalea sp.]NNK01038.1 cobalt chelatase [Desulfatitalea sp.]